MKKVARGVGAALALPLAYMLITRTFFGTPPERKFGLILIIGLPLAALLGLGIAATWNRIKHRGEPATTALNLNERPKKP
jgi:hypothetical protein